MLKKISIFLSLLALSFSGTVFATTYYYVKETINLNNSGGPANAKLYTSSGGVCSSTSCTSGTITEVASGTSFTGSYTPGNAWFKGFTVGVKDPNTGAIQKICSVSLGFGSAYSSSGYMVKPYTNMSPAWGTVNGTKYKCTWPVPCTGLCNTSTTAPVTSSTSAPTSSTYTITVTKS